MNTTQRRFAAAAAGLALAMVSLTGCARISGGLSPLREWLLDFPYLPSLKSDPVVARTNAFVVRASEIANAGKHFGRPFGAVGAAMIGSPAGSHPYLDPLVRRKTIVLLARRSGLLRDPLFRQKLALAKDQAVGQAVESAFMARIPVTEEEMRTSFQKNPPSWLAPPVQRMSRLRMTSAAQKDQAQALLRKGRSLESIAKALSLKVENVDTRPHANAFNPQMGLPMGLAWSLKPGQVSAILKTPGGYEVYRKDPQTKQSPLAFEAVKDQMRPIVQREKLDRMVSEFLAGLDLKIGEKQSK
jgi:peptidyl-prolyl cis-trans isomerase C